MNVCIRELPADLRPTNRLQYAGAAAVSSAELIAVLLGSGTQRENAIRLAETLLCEFDGIYGLARAPIEELCQLDGIGPTKATRILAALELGKRGFSTGFENRPQIRTPMDIANLLMLEMGVLETEHLRVIILDTKNYVRHVATPYAGSLNAAVIRIGEVFREPVRRLAASIVLVHNHPSGDPSPSPQDVRVTEMMALCAGFAIVEAGRLLDIGVLDHLIIGRNRYVSLKERGLGFKI